MDKNDKKIKEQTQTMMLLLYIHYNYSGCHFEAYFTTKFHWIKTFLFKFTEEQCVSGATYKPWMWQRINSATADPEHIMPLRYAFVAKLITLENNDQSAAQSEWY